MVNKIRTIMDATEEVVVPNTFNEELDVAENITQQDGAGSVAEHFASFMANNGLKPADLLNLEIDSPTGEGTINVYKAFTDEVILDNLDGAIRTSRELENMWSLLPASVRAHYQSVDGMIANFTAPHNQQFNIDNGLVPKPEKVDVPPKTE